MTTYDVSATESLALTETTESPIGSAPIADLSVGNWVNAAGGDLFPAIAERIADAATFIKSGAVGGIANAYVTLIESGRHSVICYDISAQGRALSGVVNVYCGTTLVARYTHIGVRAKTRYRQVLTPEQRELISDPADVRVEFVRAANVFAVSVAESMSLSDAATVEGDVGESADFISRRTGALRYFDFDSIEQLGPLNSNGQYANFGSMPGMTQAFPTIDTTIKKSGAGSIRFDRPSRYGSDACGSWFANFSDDLGTQFGENSHFFIQVACRWNDVMANTCFFQSNVNIFEAHRVSDTSFWTPGDRTAELWVKQSAIVGIENGMANTRAYFLIESFSYDGGSNHTTINVYDVGSALNPLLDCAYIDGANGNPNQALLALMPTIVDGDTFSISGDWRDTTQSGGVAAFRFRSTQHQNIIHGVHTVDDPGTYADNVTTITLHHMTGVLDASYDVVDEVWIQPGIKFFDVNAGDQDPGINPLFDGITHYYSSENIKIVVCTVGQTKAPSLYHYNTDVSDTNMWEDGVNYQNGGTTCLYSADAATPHGDPVVGCWTMPANEWVTFQLEVQTGDLGLYNGRNCWLDSEVRLWAWTETGGSQLLLDWNPSVAGYIPLYAEDDSHNPILLFGKTWLFPYLTGQDWTQTLPASADDGQHIARVWYDELIIKTDTRIADPQAGPFANLAANTLVDLGAYVCTECSPSGSYVCSNISVYAGWTYDSVRQRAVAFGGGHSATHYNAVNCLPMQTLTWTEEYPPTPEASWMTATGGLGSAGPNYDYDTGGWLDGPDSGPYPRPAARHTVGTLVCTPDELIVLTNVEGNPPTQAGWTGYEFQTIGVTWHYNFATKVWTPTNISANHGEWPAAAYDPVSGKILQMGQTTLSVYDPTTNPPTRTVALDFTSQNGLDHVKDENGDPYTPAFLLNANLVYSSVDDRFYYIVYEGGDIYRVQFNRTTPGNSQVVKLTISGDIPPQAQEARGNGETGFAYDSTNHIIGGGIQNNVFYAFNPLTKIWTARTMQGGDAGSLSGIDGNSQHKHDIVYSPDQNVFIFTNQHINIGSENTWAYRWE